MSKRGRTSAVLPVSGTQRRLEEVRRSPAVDEGSKQAALAPGGNSRTPEVVMSRKLIAVLGIVAIAATALAAAAAAKDNDAAATKKLRIGLVLPDLSNLYIAGIRDGAPGPGEEERPRSSSREPTTPAGQTNADACVHRRQGRRDHHRPDRRKSESSPRSRGRTPQDPRDRRCRSTCSAASQRLSSLAVRIIAGR